MQYESDITITLEELLQIAQQVGSLNLSAHQRANSILMGRHASKIRGRGMDFLELKNYVSGDDTRHIDWKATCRTGKVQLRTFQEERDRSVYIVLSQQSHMFFGSQGCFKSVQAARLASLIFHTVLKNSDRIGAVIFNDEQIRFFKAGKNPKSSLQILDAIVTFNQALMHQNQTPNPQMFNEALETLLPHVKHDDLVIFIGDGSGLDMKAQEKVTLLSEHNDCVGAIVYDPLERTLPKESALGFYWKNEYLQIDAKDAKIQEHFSHAYEQKRQNYQKLSLLQQIPVFEITTNEAVVLQLQKELGVIHGR